MPKLYRFILFAIIVILIFLIRLLTQNDSNLPIGPYIGQTPPDSQPRIFAPGFISDQFRERDAAFTPDGNEFYYSLWTGSFAVILYTKQTKGHWSRPELAPFSSGHSDIEPFITPDGSRLYFASSQPVDGDESKDYDIWYVERAGESWGDPQRLDSTINSPANEFYPTLTRDGTLYFTAQRDDSFGREDIYRAENHNGLFQQPENVGSAVNSAHDDFNALVAPDESFLFFSSVGRPGGLGGGDLYISFRENGEWQPAINMALVNSPRLDYCPALTPDGAFFLFTSSKSTLNFQPNAGFSDLKAQLLTWGNGNDDIYWVKSVFIDSMRGK